MVDNRTWRAAIVHLLRPLAQPVLRRIQYRTQTAVSEALMSERSFGHAKAAATASLEESGILTRLQELEGQIQAIPGQIQAMQSAIARSAVSFSLLMEEHRQSPDESRRDQMLECLRLRTELLLNRHVVPLSPELIAIRTPFGYVAVPQEDRQLVVYLCDGVLAEPGTAGVFKALLREGEWALDIGANVGVSTLALAHASAPSGQIISIEPSPQAAEALRTTLMINGLSKRVEVHECAANDRTGSVSLNQGTTSPLGSILQLEGSNAATLVKGQPVDVIWHQKPPVSLAKIDVEGAELLVLRGMRRTIQESPDLALVLEYAPVHLRRAGVSPSAWMEAVRAAGFEHCFRIDEASGLCFAVTEIEELNSIFSTNLLFVGANSRPLARLTDAGMRR